MSKQITGVCVVALLLVAVVLGSYWYGKRIADNQAQLHELRTELATLKAQAKQLENDRTQIKNDTSAQVAAIERKRSGINSPETAIPVIQSIDPNLDIRLDVVPGSPSVAVISNAPVSLPRLANDLLSWESCRISLQGCQKELTASDALNVNLRAQMANVGQQGTVKAKLSCGFFCKSKYALIGIGAGAAFGYLAHK